jgi:hypothetical protein
VNRTVDSYMDEALGRPRSQRPRRSLAPGWNIRKTRCSAGFIGHEDLTRPRIPKAPKLPVIPRYRIPAFESVRPAAPAFAAASEEGEDALESGARPAGPPVPTLTAPPMKPLVQPTIEAPKAARHPAREPAELQDPRLAANALGLGAAAGLLVIVCLFLLRFA